MKLVDWAIVACYVAFSLWVGLLARKRVRNVADYLVADRGVKLYLGIAALTGTEMGIISLMAMSEFGFRHGFAAMTLGLCFFVGVTFIGATGFIINGLRRHGVMTIPEFYGKRYGTGVRWLGGVVLALCGILNMGVFLKVGAVFFTEISGLEQSYVNWVMGTLLVIVLAYTLLGGMISVVFTDYFQFLILMVGVAIATGFSLQAVGIGAMRTAVAETHGAAGFSPVANPEMSWAFIIFNALVFMAVPAVWQPAAARALSAINPGVARKTMLVSGLTFMGRGALPILWGIAALAYFRAHPDRWDPALPIIHAMPRFLEIVLPTGLLGLFVAGMFAADMSTYNGYLLAWSSILTQDVVAPLTGDRLSQRARLTINRVLIVVIGAFLLWMGLVYEPPATFIEYQNVTGTIYLSGALACVAMGIYWRRANAWGAAAATLLGTAFPVATVFLRGHLGWIPDSLANVLRNGWLSGLLAFALSFTAIVVVSLVTAPGRKDDARSDRSADGTAGPDGPDMIRGPDA